MSRPVASLVPLGAGDTHRAFLWLKLNQTDSLLRPGSQTGADIRAGRLAGGVISGDVSVGNLSEHFDICPSNRTCLCGDRPPHTQPPPPSPILDFSTDNFSGGLVAKDQS